MSVSGLPNILLIIADDRRGWRQRNGDFRRCKHPDTAIARRAGRAARRCPDKVNRGTPRLAHVIDLYQTISTLAGTEIWGADEDIDSRDLEPLFRDSGLQPEVRAYNFSQAFKQRRGEVGATIRNLGYKLNHDVTRDSVYSLCRYVGVEVRRNHWSSIGPGLLATT